MAMACSTSRLATTTSAPSSSATSRRTRVPSSACVCDCRSIRNRRRAQPGRPSARRRRSICLMGGAWSHRLTAALVTQASAPPSYTLALGLLIDRFLSGSIFAGVAPTAGCTSTPCNSSQAGTRYGWATNPTRRRTASDERQALSVGPPGRAAPVRGRHHPVYHPGPHLVRLRAVLCPAAGRVSRRLQHATVSGDAGGVVLPPPAALPRRRHPLLLRFFTLGPHLRAGGGDALVRQQPVVGDGLCGRRIH